MHRGEINFLLRYQFDIIRFSLAPSHFGNPHGLYVDIERLQVTGCIIIEDKIGGQGKGYPKPGQTFQVRFNELLFISIALKPN